MPIRILTSTLSTDDIRQAVAGDASTLDRVLRSVLHDVYGLALRFLWHPSDAEDATQEIAIRVLTGLSGFDGRSAFRTWVYRIAYNTLSALARKRAEDTGLSFDGMSEDLQEGLIDAAREPPRLPFDAALIEEVKTGCTLAMLTCLDRDHRLAYIIGTILDRSRGGCQRAGDHALGVPETALTRECTDRGIRCRALRRRGQRKRVPLRKACAEGHSPRTRGSSEAGVRAKGHHAAGVGRNRPMGQAARRRAPSGRDLSLAPGLRVCG